MKHKNEGFIRAHTTDYPDASTRSNINLWIDDPLDLLVKSPGSGGQFYQLSFGPTKSGIISIHTQLWNLRHNLEKYSQSLMDNVNDRVRQVLTALYPNRWILQHSDKSKWKLYQNELILTGHAVRFCDDNDEMNTCYYLFVQVPHVNETKAGQSYHRYFTLTRSQKELECPRQHQIKDMLNDMAKQLHDEVSTKGCSHRMPDTEHPDLYTLDEWIDRITQENEREQARMHIQRWRESKYHVT